MKAGYLGPNDGGYGIRICPRDEMTDHMSKEDLESYEVTHTSFVAFLTDFAAGRLRQSAFG